jgi:preprotein translocase subunit SecA
MQMPVGRRQTFDKKTHKRVFAQTTRLTYIHAAARALEARSPEEITEEVLAHLENAQAAIHQEWGRSQLESLGGISLAELDESSRAGLENALGAEVFDQVKQQAVNALEDTVQEQVADELGRQALTKIYRELMLRVISNLWIEYLTQMEALRVAIGLEAYAQRDPLVQYKTRAFEMFQNLLLDMRMSVVTRMFTFRPTGDVSTVQVGAQKPDVPEPKEIEQKDQPKKKRRRRRRRK